MYSYSYPDPFVDPRKKDEKYIGQYMRAAWYENSELYPNGFFRSWEKYHQIKKYMMGQQSTGKYNKQMDPLHQGNPDKTWLNIDGSILALIPKFRRIAVSMLGKRKYDLQANVIDPVAVEDRDKYYKKILSKIMVRKKLEEMGLSDKAEVLGLKDSDPQNEEELEMKMKYGYKHDYALNMEIALNLVLNCHNKFEEIRRGVREDLVDFGIGCIQEYIDSNGIIRVRKPDIQQLVVGYSKQKDFSDTRHIGETHYKTIHQIAKESKGKFTVEQLKDIAETHAGYLRNPRNYQGDEYLNYRVQVFELEFYSTNVRTHEKRVNKYGNKVVTKAKPKRNYNSRSYSSMEYNVVYKGKWIVGTDYYYDCGLATDMKRHKNNLSETKLSYHIIVPELYEMQTSSIGEQLITIADQLQIAWRKFQNAVLRARTAGIWVDIGTLLNVPLKGAGGERFKPLEVVDLLYQRGDLIFKGYDDYGKPLPYKPIGELQGTNTEDLTKWFGVINGLLDLARGIVGFNEITDASTPDPRTLKTVAQLSVDSTNNSIDDLRAAEISLVKEMANDLTLRIQDQLAKGEEISGYYKALGKNTADFMRVDPTATRYTFGVDIIEAPTDVQKAKLDMRIEKALDKGELTYADVTFIENFTNINQAEEMLSYRVRKNLERQQAEKDRAIQLTAEEQRKSAAMAEAEKRKTIMLDGKVKFEIEKFKALAKLKESEAKNQARLGESKEITYRDLLKKQMEVDSNEYIKELQEAGEAA